MKLCLATIAFALPGCLPQEARAQAGLQTETRTQRQVQSAPACRIEAAALDERLGNAGCLIALDGKSLLIEHRPGGRLGFPGGTAASGEQAQCTAHRETWEETGLDVEVGPFLKRLSTGFLLYACTADRAELSTDAEPPVAEWSRGEVQRLVWRDLDTVPAAQWRFPDQIEEVAGLDDL